MRVNRTGSPYCSTRCPAIVDVQWAVVERGRRIRAFTSPPAQCADPGNQFARPERLDQVVVRPAVETPDLVAFGSERGQHQQRGLGHDGDALDHLPAVEFGQPHVENDDVGPQPVELAQCGVTIRCLGHIEPRVLEHGVDQFTDVVGVLDDKDKLILFPQRMNPIPLARDCNQTHSGLTAIGPQGPHAQTAHARTHRPQGVPQSVSRLAAKAALM